ncbi:MAG: peptidylprolyl isomerase FKBP-type [Candidatus Krumholzibacteriota bacterium]|nr:peptidylprolyl isomerase FKBP-type [Candidatus Krumholzibacteriota bacterium]
MKILYFSVAIALLAFSFGCGSENQWTTESGLQVTEVVEGEGELPEKGDILKLHYTGWYLDGEMFDTTDKLEGPATVRFGHGNLLPGLEEGVATMRKGGKRILVLPPELAFGKEGRPGVVPPGKWVKFEVELVEIEPGPPPILPWNDAGMEVVTTNSGLQIVDFVVGEGDYPKVGDTVVVSYSAFLDDGTLFDTTYYNRAPVEFVLDVERLIPGWVEALLTMRVGGQRKIVVPPFLGYGAKGYGKSVPPNATLMYDIELLEIVK